MEYLLIKIYPPKVEESQNLADTYLKFGSICRAYFAHIDIFGSGVGGKVVSDVSSHS